MKREPTKPAPKKRQRAQGLVPPDNPRQESTDYYTENEMAELFDFGNALPGGWFDFELGAIARLPAGRLLRLILLKVFVKSRLATPEGREEEKSHHAEIGRVILEAIRGDNPAAFFSQLAKWYQTPEKQILEDRSGQKRIVRRRDLKLRDFDIKKGKGRQKQRTDNDFLFSWALGSLLAYRDAENRRCKISLSEIMDQIKVFGGSISETEAYKRVRISGFTPFLAGRKRT